eukprot:7049890-Pyramimonas_sp.AAC.1
MELELLPDGLGEEPAPQPPQPGTARHKPAAKSAAGKKGQRWCRGCNKWHPETTFAMNQALEASCKKALDAISGQARRQGAE